MIESVSVKNLRGIREATLEQLTPLVLLVGPNGCGKSTLLEALLIGGGRRPAQNAAEVVRRRTTLRHAARWLLQRGGEAGPAEIEVARSGGERLRCALRWSSSEIEERLRQQLAERRADRPYGQIDMDIVAGEVTHPVRMAFAADNSYAFEETDPFTSIRPAAWMVDARHGVPLHDLYSRVVERGRRQSVLDLVATLVPGLQMIEVLTDQDNPRLHLTFDDHSVPVALGGDGFQGLVRLCLELAARADGTLLLEEPEAHQHPAAIRAGALAISQAMRGGIQIILTTHSLELIDALLSVLADHELDVLSLYRLKLERGVMKHHRLGGSAVLRSRDEIKDDLR